MGHSGGRPGTELWAGSASRNLAQRAQRLKKFKISSVDVSDIFYFFCSGGEGKGVRGAVRVGGVGILLKMPGGGGGGLPKNGEGDKGPGGCLRGIGVGGAKYFFSGPKFPASFAPRLKLSSDQSQIKIFNRD